MKSIARRHNGKTNTVHEGIAGCFPSLGLAIFFYLIYSVGVYEILSSIKLVDLVRNVDDRYGYKVCYSAHSLGIIALTRIRGAFAIYSFQRSLAGDAVRLLSFTGPFLGEPSKAFLVRDRLPIAYGVPSIVVENLCFMLTSVFIIVTGLSLFVANSTLQSSVK